MHERHRLLWKSSAHMTTAISCCVLTGAGIPHASKNTRVVAANSSVLSFMSSRIIELSLILIFCHPVHLVVTRVNCTFIFPYLVLPFRKTFEQALWISQFKFWDATSMYGAAIPVFLLLAFLTLRNFCCHDLNLCSSRCYLPMQGFSRLCVPLNCMQCTQDNLILL